MRSGCCAILGLVLCGAAQAQTDWQHRLVGHPLYLQGAWTGPVLEFDGTGKPLKDAKQGSLTLSGVDVESVALHGERMEIHGYRVMLVADDNGMLKRFDQTSTTNLSFTYQKKYVSRDAVKITLHADEAGSFEAPVKAVFADGLADLAESVPEYWRCYAQAYFAGSVEKAAADAQVERVRAVEGPGLRLEATA